MPLLSFSSTPSLNLEKSHTHSQIFRKISRHRVLFCQHYNEENSKFLMLKILKFNTYRWFGSCLMNVYCTLLLYSVHCEPYSAHSVYTGGILQCTLYTVLCAVYMRFCVQYNGYLYRYRYAKV